MTRALTAPRRSDEGRGRSPRAGVHVHEQELVNAAPGQLFGGQVLEAEQAHLHVHGLRNDEWALQIFARHRADAPRSGAECRDPPMFTRTTPSASMRHRLI